MPEDYRGVLQCDAYAAYSSFARSRGSAITLAGCWAHARRAFFEAMEQAPQIGPFILRQIAALYRLEDQLRSCGAGPNLRSALRASQAAMILARLRKLLERLQTTRRYLPQSLMGKAIAYALSNWESLCLFRTDGRVEIDNNMVENAIRPTALGKKNWLFFGAVQAGQSAAILYTIIENCRRRDINPFEYLRDVFQRLPNLNTSDYPSLTPQAWAKERKGHCGQTVAKAA